MLYKSRIGFVFLVIIFVLQVGISLAAEIGFVPSIGIRGEYDDNIDFSRVNKQDDYVGTISPAFTLDYVTYLLSVQAAVRLDFKRYLEETNQDTEDQRYSLNASYQLSERLSINGNGSYVKDTTLESELEETGIVTPRSERKSYNAGGGLLYTISAVSNTGIDYNHSENEYASAGSDDYTDDLVSFFYSRTLNNSLDTITLTPSYDMSDSDRTAIDTYRCTLGLTHIFSETFSGYASAGIRYTETDYKIVNDSDTDWGWTADIGFQKSWEVSSLSGGYSRGLRRSSEGEPIEVNRFNVSYSKNLTTRVIAGLSGSLYFTKSKGQFTEEDKRYFDISPSLSYLITEDHRVEIGYNYSNEYDKNLTDDREVDRNRAWILLSFNFPQKW